MINQDKVDKELRERGELTGFYAQMAQPLYDTKSQIDLMKKLSHQQKLDLLS